MPLPNTTPRPKALLFDVFGTVVDWRTTVSTYLHTASHIVLNSATSSIPSSVRLVATDYTLSQWSQFALEWRQAYWTYTRSVAAGTYEGEFKSIDVFLREELDRLVQRWGVEGLWVGPELDDIARVWHRLDGWEDSARGIRELNKQGFKTCTLSNGNVELLRDMAEHAGLEWTKVFGAEQFGGFKPAEKVYLGAVGELGLEPGECAMVAAHLGDLKAAKGCGLTTIFVERPGEEEVNDEVRERVKQEGYIDLWIDQSEEGFLTLAKHLNGDFES